MRKLYPWFTILALVAGINRSSAADHGPQHGLQIIGYFTEGGAKSGQYSVRDVAASGSAALLTELDYAFGKIVNDTCAIDDSESALHRLYGKGESVDGTDDATRPGQLHGIFGQLQELKRHFPNLKIVISFGGWGQSSGFVAAAQPDHVQGFVQSCVDTFIRGRFSPELEVPGLFDGIDIDWEYPVEGGVSPGRPEDKRNFTNMVAEFRKELDAVRPGLLLTAALPAEEEFFRNFELAKISAYLDDLSIMAYDLHWDSEPNTNFHSALFHDGSDMSKPPLDKRYGDFAVEGFLRAGVPALKIVLGVPFYGKGWNGVKDVNGGLYQPANGPTKRDGSYRALKALSQADRRFHENVESCTIWQNESFWSYDCPQAMRAKVAYAKRKHLAGVMFWELSEDSADGELLHVLAGN